MIDPKVLNFQVEPDEPPPKPQGPSKASIDLLVLALKTISQRVLLAFVSLFTLITVGSVFWVWMSIPDPNPNQLVSLGMYALFVLIINWIATRR